MKFRLIRNSAFLVPILALLAGCAIPLPINSLIPDSAGPNSGPSALTHNVCVRAGDHGHVVYNVVEVSPAQLQTTLWLALVHIGYGGTPKSCTYALTATIVHLSGPEIYLPFLPETFDLTIRYRLIAKSTAKVVFDRTIHSSYTQSYQFVPLAGAVPTQRKGEEHVFKRNIGRFETTLRSDQAGFQ